MADHRRVGFEVAACLAPKRPNRNAPPSLDLEASPHGGFRTPLDPGRLEVRAARDVEHEARLHRAAAFRTSEWRHGASLETRESEDAPRAAPGDGPSVLASEWPVQLRAPGGRVWVVRRPGDVALPQIRGRRVRPGDDPGIKFGPGGAEALVGPAV